jgi:uncharacterized delta-60 repeat protein
MVHVRLGLAVAMVAGSLSVTSQVQASEGVPDPSFGTGGVATYELGLEGSRRQSQFSALGVSSDGNIYVVGDSSDTGDSASLVARLTDSGALDPSFGAAGVVLGQRGATAGEPLTSGNAVSVESDDLTVAGTSEMQAANPQLPQLPLGGFVERLTPSGAIAPTFKTEALAFPADLLQQLPGGRLLVAGRPRDTASGEEPDPRVPALLELLSRNGAPVSSFGHDGTVELFDYFGERTWMTVRSVLSQGNGDLLVSGVGLGLSKVPGPRGPEERESSFLWLGRLTPSGALDPRFGDDGMSIIQTAQSIAKPPGPGLLEPRAGGFALVGTTENEDHQAQVAVWGLTESGAPDLSYGSGGVAIVPDIPSEVGELPTAATVDNSGRLLVAASSGEDGNAQLVRITPDGQIDRSFGREGVAEGPPKSVFAALAVEPSGRVLAAGSLEPQTGEADNGDWFEQHGLQALDSLIERFIATNAQSASTAPSATVRLVSPHIAASRNGIPIKLACAGAAACSGTLIVTTAGKDRRKRRKEVVIARRSFAIAPSRTATCVLSLNATGRALLQARDGHARLTITKSKPTPRETRVDQIQITRTSVHARSRCRVLRTPRDACRAAADRQRQRLPLRRARDRLPRPRNSSPAHTPLPPPDQRQDATYVALAEALGCELVTGDGRLADAPGLGCPVKVLL